MRWFIYLVGVLTILHYLKVLGGGEDVIAQPAKSVWSQIQGSAGQSSKITREDCLDTAFERVRAVDAVQWAEACGNYGITVAEAEEWLTKY